jgi:hypothetical protein
MKLNATPRQTERRSKGVQNGKEIRHGDLILSLDPGSI